MKRLPAPIRIAITTAVAFSTPGTTLTTLLLIPLLSVALLAFASHGLTGAFPMTSAYAAVVVAFGSTVLGGVVAEVTRDRNIGVLSAVLLGGLWQPLYWLGKILVPVAAGVVVALGSLTTLFALDPERDGRMLAAAFVAAVAVCLSGAMIGAACAMLTLGGNDPYLASNLIRGVIFLGTGVLLPIDQYPLALEVAGRLLPFTAIIEGLRAESFVPAIAIEAGVVLMWCGSAWAVSGIVMRRWRSGKVRELLW